MEPAVARGWRGMPWPCGRADVTALSLLEEIRGLKFFSLYSIDLLANCAYLGGAPERVRIDACPSHECYPSTRAPAPHGARPEGAGLLNWMRGLASTSRRRTTTIWRSILKDTRAMMGRPVWKFLYENLNLRQGGHRGRKRPERLAQRV